MSATAHPDRRSAAPPVALTPLTRQSDDRLVELSRSGDERAFETLVRRHHHELRVYAGRLLGAEGRAEDALQHALMSAWVALRDRDTTVANPRAWLYGIVHNSAVTMLRRARHDTVALNDALDAPHTPDRPDVHLVVGEILAGLSAMPEPQRRALLMTSVAGASHEEAATALGVSGGAVRGMVYRARAALRQAAAAVLPGPLWSWAARLAHRRARVPVDPTDTATAVTSASAGAAGAAALVVKGGAIVAAAGALAGTGGALLPALSGRPPHRAPAASHRLSPRRTEAVVRSAPAAIPVPRRAEPRGRAGSLHVTTAPGRSRGSGHSGRHDSQGAPSLSSSHGAPSNSRGGPSGTSGGPSGSDSGSSGGPSGSSRHSARRARTAARPAAPAHRRKRPV